MSDTKPRIAIIIRTTPDRHAKLKALAQERDTSVTDVMRQAIDALPDPGPPVVWERSAAG
jgi:predicted transcriptional regulator